MFIFFQLSNRQFEELAMDVYDEVDRRETDAGEISRIVKQYDSVYNAFYCMSDFYLGVCVYIY